MTQSPDHPKDMKASRCPRCGYDQRGLVATWVDSCPLHGTCSECGLIFRCRDVLDPPDSMEAWSIEHAQSWVSVPWRTIRTLLMMSVPWRFWSQLQMHQPIRTGRIFAMYFVLVALIVALSVAAEDPVLRGYLGWFRGIEFAILSGHLKINPSHFTVVLAVVAVIMPIGFVALPVSRRTARVQWRHVWRITLYSFAPIILLVMLDKVSYLIFAYVGLKAWIHWLSHSRNILLYAIVPLFLCMWWGFAIDRYLKMRHALGIAICMFIMAVLVFAMSMAIATMFDDV